WLGDVPRASTEIYMLKEFNIPTVRRDSVCKRRSWSFGLLLLRSQCSTPSKSVGGLFAPKYLKHLSIECIAIHYRVQRFTEECADVHRIGFGLVNHYGHARNFVSRAVTTAATVVRCKQAHRVRHWIRYWVHHFN